MDELVGKRGIRRYHEFGRVDELEDALIGEYRLRIRLDGKDFVDLALLPSLLDEFIVGFLRTRGLIEGIQDISSIQLSDDEARVERAPHLRGHLPDTGILETTGTRNVDLSTSALPFRKRHDPDFSVPAKQVFEGVEMLSEMPIYKQTGGTHCAILFPSEGDPLPAEDIGRHTAVDKAIGSGLKRGADFGRCWLAVSGRLPADMVYKPALVGIPLVASVSAPTLGGVALAEKAGITLIGFTRGSRFNCYTHPERIT